jgi:hypothetical protein
MTTLQLYQAIKALILANITNYANATIFSGQQNNTVMPTSGNYVIMTKLIENNEILIPQQSYDPVANIDSSTTLIEGIFQIDFYGNTAEEDSGQFVALLNSRFANEFFVNNNFNCRVSYNDDPLNLTIVSGREQYLPRFMVKLKLFYNRIVTQADNGIVTINGTTYCAEALP